MISINRSIVICIVASFLVFLKILTNNNMFLVGFLILIIGGMIKESNENRINYLLYFVSWIYVIKFDLGQFSLFVFISAFYCILTLAHIFNTKKKVPQRLILVLILHLFFLFISAMQGIGQSIFQVFGFVLGYMVIILSSLSLQHTKTTYPIYVFHYSVGLFVGSCVRLLGYFVPTIESYVISMGRINTVITDGNLYSRFAGLDIDPNYYAIQVIFAIALNLLSIFYLKKKLIVNVIIAGSLTVFGMLSFSKMYIIMLCIIGMLMFLIVLRKNTIYKFNYLIGMIIILGTIFYIYGDVFYDVYFTRFFGQGESLNNITSGRSIIWESYITEIFANVPVLIFGNGITTGFLDDKITHNMYLLALYQLGILGVSIYCMLIYCIYKTIRNTSTKSNKAVSFLNTVPLFVIIISNMSLDSFAMDYFPLQIFLAMLSLVIYKIDGSHLGEEKIC